MPFVKTFLIFCILSTRISSLPDTIRIGGIFDPQDKQLEIAFEYAVEKINNDREILPKSQLLAEVERLPADDSFHASKRVCELLRSGVAGIFGPQSENTANHVQSICDAMEIPHIETRWDFRLTGEASSINLYPHPTSLGQAYSDVIRALDWQSFVLIYDSSHGLVRLQSLLKYKDWKVSIKQLNEGNNWRPLLKSIKKSQATKFVIDVSQDILYDLLKQAYQMGLMREYHSYFITSLDMHLVDIEDFRYGGTNITSLRIIDPNSPGVKKVIEDWKYGRRLRYGGISPELDKITTEAALMHDAVHLFATALNDLDESREVDISVLYCEGDKTWQHGNSLINYMKWYSSRRVDENTLPRGQYAGYGSRNFPYGVDDYSRARGTPEAENFYRRTYMTDQRGYSYPEMSDRNRMLSILENSMMNRNASTLYQEVQVNGLTGIIKFDTQGFRTDFELEITEIHSKVGIKKVGMWTKAGGANYTRTYKEIQAEISSNLQNRTFVVTTAKTAPYTMLKNTSETLEGNDRFEGFCIDLIHEISQILGFNYTLKLVSDGNYGSKMDDGKWNGMIGELHRYEADLAIVDFTITYEREEAVDFSMPFMNLGIGIIYSKPQKTPPRLFSFMSPFSVDVWIYMATAYLGVSVLLFMLARIAPNEWDNPHPCIQDPDELENAITLSNAFWFTIGSLMQQGSDIAPKALSTRIVAGIWWFFTLIMISSYTANLAAFLTVERMDSPIEGAEDLAKQTKIKYGCKHGGSTYSFFAESNIQTYKRMWSSMSSARPTVFTANNEAGVERVSKSNGMYAFLMESVSIEYEIERKCDLMQVGGLLDSKSYGIALPPTSPYTGQISQAILQLKEAGVIHNLKTKWWKRMRGGGRCVADSEEDPATAAELGLDNVGGVFVVMAFGGACACVLACCEFTWKARKLAAQEGDTFLKELWNELKFIAKCSENEKPVRKYPSASSTLNKSSEDFNTTNP